MNSIFTYLLLGVSLAAPVGPVNAAQLDKGIKNGFFHAWIFGVGALIADMIYMLMVYLGVIHFIDTSFMKTFLWLFGFFVLSYTGVESLLSSGKIVTDLQSAGKKSLSKSFFTGFLMSISNPLTILFWLGIYGSVLAKTAETFSNHQLVTYSLAIITGILLWDFTMATISSLARRLLNSTILKAISFLSSMSMIGFGLYFGYQAFKALF
ncbi:threonine/homoserine/homoserine lactone efflux protein [Bacillus pakistanensis]|uniref:Threonine/homoserine/homoserine lactone efflux protein n=1 Tax=Rossellomorea pakistanensis TaxID=992288 RepID=A0ABS2NCH3_9BACI|nr:LysE family transporter [Bacillus pakistanensis]MBM7585562.1 threonine/homoserine/homoserine lactone efflux protein [Bacillus pakistanensis]